MYCSVADIITHIDRKFINSTSNDSGDPSTINDSIVNDIIATNTGIIDDILRGRYSLPLINQHTILKYICIELTKFELIKRKTTPSQAEFDLYNLAMDKLRAVSSGDYTLDGEEFTSKSIMINSGASLFLDTVKKYRSRFLW